MNGKTFELKLSGGVPATEHSNEFHQGMVDRMGISFFKYGPLAQGFPTRVNAIASLEERLLKYKSTGNTEWLMDVANFAMIEFMRPRHPEAHYKPTDSRESPGRVWVGEVNGIPDANDFTVR